MSSLFDSIQLLVSSDGPSALAKLVDGSEMSLPPAVLFRSGLIQDTVAFVGFDTSFNIPAREGTPWLRLQALLAEVSTDALALLPDSELVQFLQVHFPFCIISC